MYQSRSSLSYGIFSFPNYRGNDFFFSSFGTFGYTEKP
jgi:hypothetical protein